MEIVLDELTQHTTNEPTDLSGQDVYGHVYIHAEVLIRALERVGLHTGYHQRAVHYFRGEIGGLNVEVQATMMVYGRRGMQYNSRGRVPGIPYYKLKAYMPTNTHIRGKGRDKYAWSVYRLLVHVIEWERAKYARG